MLYLYTAHIRTMKIDMEILKQAKAEERKHKIEN